MSPLRTQAAATKSFTRTLLNDGAPVGAMILGLGGCDDLFLHGRAIGWALWPRYDSCAFGAAGVLSWIFCNKSSTVI